jgi:hypothetical protein
MVINIFRKQQIDKQRWLNEDYHQNIVIYLKYYDKRIYTKLVIILYILLS